MRDKVKSYKKYNHDLVHKVTIQSLESITPGKSSHESPRQRLTGSWEAWMVGRRKAGLVRPEPGTVQVPERITVAWKLLAEEPKSIRWCVTEGDMFSTMTQMCGVSSLVCDECQKSRVVTGDGDWLRVASWQRYGRKGPSAHMLPNRGNDKLNMVPIKC